MNDARRSEAEDIMLRFADRTGLTSDRPSRRYLWTDAFAVCNFLALERRDLALRLVERVHAELGRHRGDDGRSGPLGGGLRIGKPLRERAPHERYDEELEWERDGQYFHYLTKWMHALHQVALDVPARELMFVAHRAFVYGLPGQRRMFWKMSIDLSRPLLPSMGHHDALDGLVTCAELDASPGKAPSLANAISDFGEMCACESLTTMDPLGLGGLLFDACRLAQLGVQGELREEIVTAAVEGLRYYAADPDLHAPAHHRLPFRELGLAASLAGVPMLGDARLAPFVPLRDAIESFWRKPANRRASTWSEHEDINEVMLATSLVPEGFLFLPQRAGRIDDLRRANAK